MNSVNADAMIKILIITPFIGGLITFVGGKIHKRIRFLLATIFSFVTMLEAFSLYNLTVDSVVWGSLFGSKLVFQTNPITWLFLFIVTVMSVLIVLFSIGDMEENELRLDSYYMHLLFVEGAMAGIVLAGDLITFFIFWEIMSWTSYFLVIHGGKRSLDAGYKYIIMSIIGAYSMFIAIAMLYVKAHSLVYGNIARVLAIASPSFTVWVVVLLAVGLFVKAAVMPLHTWLPDAHSEAPSPVSPLLSGVLIKMGAYGLFVVLYAFLTVNLASKIMPHVFSTPLLLYIIQWLAALSIVLATFLAIMQEDAKRLLAYSSISQIGYVVLGLATATSLGVAGGLFHALNHAIFKGLLFLAVGAVIYRTGTRDLSKLGGLVRKMPFTFTALLIGIIALAGVPPMSGFVSKWMIYEALLQKREVFLLIMAFIGSTGAFLYVYRLIHSIFLGQLPQKYEDVKDVPVIMQIPIWVLAVLTMVLGVFPGLAMNVIVKGIAFFGFKPIAYTLYGFPAGTAMGALKVVNIVSVLMISFIVAWIFFLLFSKSRKVSQYDNYAAGQVVTPDLKYNYSFGFYMSFGRVIKPVLKWSIERVYNYWIDASKIFGDYYLRRVYTGNLETYNSYILIIVTIAATAILLGGKLW